MDRRSESNRQKRWGGWIDGEGESRGRVDDGEGEGVLRGTGETFLEW